MEEKFTVSDCLTEIRRLRAENARLTRLAASRRPEMSDLRDLEVGVRDLVDNIPRQLVEILGKARAITGNQDDLPTLEELEGIWSDRRDAIYAELDEPPATPDTDTRGVRRR